MKGARIKPSAIFFIVFLSGSILITPFIDRVGAMILKSELHEALEYFMEKHCNDKIEILQIDSPDYTSNYVFSASRTWGAEVSLDGYYFSGEVAPRARYVSMVNSCNERYYLLNRKSKRFEEYNGPLDPVAGGVITKQYLAVTLVIWLVGFFTIRRFENRIENGESD